MKYNTKKTIILSILFFTTIVVIASLLLSLSFNKQKTKPCTKIETTIKIKKLPEIKFFFNNEGDKNDLNKIISDEIDNAQKSLEIAVYSIKSEKIKKAIYQAYNRGIKVDLILDYHKKEDHDQFFSDLPAGINRIDLGHSWPNKVLMHHKFALIDRGHPEEKLIFGDFNWTDLQEKYDRNFILISNETNLIDNFGQEFLRLKNKISGPDKLTLSNYNPKNLQLQYISPIDNQKTMYELWFSPGSEQNNINHMLLNEISKAENNIKIMIWSFSDKSIAKELVDKAKNGVKVQIIGDGLNFYSDYSVFNYLLKEKKEHNIKNLEILSAPYIMQNESTDEVLGPREAKSFLHHHLIILDNNKIIFGTNNWSSSGAHYNDEAAIYTTDTKIISNFLKSYNHNLNISQIIN